jgi:hypothetical protein
MARVRMGDRVRYRGRRYEVYMVTDEPQGVYIERYIGGGSTERKRVSEEALER